MNASAHETVNILVVVDAQSIQAGTGQLVYMVDDNNPPSTGEGSTELVTIAPAGSTLVWRATSINPAFSVEITSIHRSSSTDVFTAPPAQQADGSWSAILGNFGSGSQETYQIMVASGGNTYTWDPFVSLQ
jgi:Inclusion body protein